MYGLEELKDGDGKFVGVRIVCGSQVIAQLKGGFSYIIATQHAALHGDWSKNAFLYGIVLTMSHYALADQVMVSG